MRLWCQALIRPTHVHRELLRALSHRTLPATLTILKKSSKLAFFTPRAASWQCFHYQAQKRNLRGSWSPPRMAGTRLPRHRDETVTRRCLMGPSLASKADDRCLARFGQARRPRLKKKRVFRLAQIDQRAAWQRIAVDQDRPEADRNAAKWALTQLQTNDRPWLSSAPTMEAGAQFPLFASENTSGYKESCVESMQSEGSENGWIIRVFTRI